MAAAIITASGGSDVFPASMAGGMTLDQRQIVAASWRMTLSLHLEFTYFANTPVRSVKDVSKKENVGWSGCADNFSKDTGSTDS